MLDTRVEKACIISLALTYRVVEVFKQAVRNLLGCCTLDVVYVDTKQALQISLFVLLRRYLPPTSLLLFLVVSLCSFKSVSASCVVFLVDAVQLWLAVQLSA